MLKPTAILLLAILISFNPPHILQAQDKKDKDQTIRLKSDLVQVRAVVTDKRGQLIGDLNKEDFELLENTRPQKYQFLFSRKDRQCASGRGEAW